MSFATGTTIFPLCSLFFHTPDDLERSDIQNFAFLPHHHSFQSRHISLLRGYLEIPVDNAAIESIPFFER